MGKNDGSGKAIYGQVPEDGVDEVFNAAMDVANDFESNKINGPTKSKLVDYDPEEGK